MKLSFVILILFVLLLAPAMSVSDTIYLKNGRRIDANECWEDGSLVLCKQYGATVGYRMNDISTYQVTGTKPKESVKVDESEIIGKYQLSVTDKIQTMWSYDGASSIDSVLGIARIGFTIVQNGNIQDIEFVELSTDPYLNIAAFSAIMKALPFPTFSHEMTVMNLKMLLVFTVEGVQ